jgi:hypothetical protein
MYCTSANLFLLPVTKTMVKNYVGWWFKIEKKRVTLPSLGNS